MTTAADSADVPLFTARFALVLCATATFGIAFSTYFLLPKYLAIELAADARTIGGVNAIAMVASVIAMPIIGVLVDSHGRKFFGVLGGVIFAAASAGYLWVEEIGPLLWLLRAAQGTAFTLFYVSASTLATDLSPPERLGQAIGLFGAVMISTNALGPALAEYGAAAYGWRGVFWATVIAAALSAILTLLIRERRPRTAHHERESMLALLRRPGLMPVLAAAALVGCTMGTVYTFYQPWALELGLEQVSAYLIGFALCAMAVRLGLGGLADRLGRLRVALVALALYISAPLSLIWLESFGLFLTGSLLGLAHGVFFPALNAVTLERAQAGDRGKAMAAFHGSFNVGFAAGSYLLGYVAIAAGYPLIFMIAGGTCALAFLVLLTLARGAGETARQTSGGAGETPG